MSKPQKSSEAELSALRSLLIDNERKQIRSLDKQIRELQALAGSEKEFSDTLTNVLIGALNRVQREDPKALTRTLSPSVVTSIKREITNSRDEMVEALFPITGRMVAASVKDAIQRLSEDINHRFDHATSPQFLLAKVRSKITGRPVSDFTLLGQSSAIVNQILLIERGSGISVAHWSADIDTGGDKDMVGGLLSAISAFANETYKDKSNTELRTIDLNGRKLAIRHSAKHILAVDFDGHLADPQKQQIDAAFLDLLEQIDGSDETGLETEIEAVAKSISESEEQQKKSYKGVLFLLGFLALLVGYFAWQYYATWSFNSKVSEVEAAVNAVPEIAAYPISVTGNQSENQIEVAGVIPQSLPPSRIEAVVAQLNIDRTATVFKLSQVPDQAYVTQQQEMLSRLAEGLIVQNERIEGLFQSLASQKTEIDGKLSELSAQLEKSSTFAAEINEENQSKAATLQTAIKELRTDLDSSSLSQNQLAQSLQGIFGNLDQASQIRSGLSATLEDFSSAISDLAQIVKDNQDRLSVYQKADRERLGFSKVYFSEGSSFQDTTQADTVLREVATIMLRNGFDLHVSGHSDASGSEQTNVRLSSARAAAIVNRLVELGVPGNRLSSEGLGSAYPHASAQIDAKLNRRVEFSVPD